MTDKKVHIEAGYDSESGEVLLRLEGNAGSVLEGWMLLTCMILNLSERDDTNGNQLREKFRRFIMDEEMFGKMMEMAREELDRHT
ncbi:MAG: hypothetical protein KBS59_03145 [Clostridiales bacterium]|nr:hypothetical protein [Clostridiales bacterium]